MKIIFINYQSLSLKKEKDFFICELLERGIEVEYWDISQFYSRNLKFIDAIDRPYVRMVTDYKELKKMIESQDIEKTFFNPQMSYENKLLRLFFLLTRKCCKLFYFGRYGLPIEENNNQEITIIKKIKHFFNNFIKSKNKIEKINSFIKHNFNRIFLKILKKTGLIKDFDVVFTSGQTGHNLHLSAKKRVAVNHFDYDDYLRVKNRKERILEKKYCVFLDDQIIDSNDFKIMNIKSIDASCYIKKLNCFFLELENRFGFPVVIAAHPKAKYDKGLFGGRKIIYNKTNYLVKDCEYTITHASTSISFPVLYNKPILFIHTDEFEKLYENTILKHQSIIAKLLGFRTYNIDDIGQTNELKLPDIDVNKYKDYIYENLTSRESENRLTIDIIIKYFT